MPDRCIYIAVKCLALKESPKGKWSWISEYRQHSNLVQVHLAPAISFANMVSVSACFLGRLPSIHCFPSISHPALIYCSLLPCLFTAATVLRPDWPGYLAAQLTGNVVFTFQTTEEEVLMATHTHIHINTHTHRLNVTYVMGLCVTWCKGESHKTCPCSGHILLQN